MKLLSAQKTFVAILVLSVAANANAALPKYGKAGVLDSAGTKFSAVDLASINCFDNGNGNGVPNHIAAIVQDTSPAVSGLYVSMHVFKDGRMATVTDPVSANNKWSGTANLNRGKGLYYLSLNKSNKGKRNYKIQYECRNAKNLGTGTSFKWLQNQ